MSLFSFGQNKDTIKCEQKAKMEKTTTNKKQEDVLMLHFGHIMYNMFLFVCLFSSSLKVNKKSVTLVVVLSL